MDYKICNTEIYMYEVESYFEMILKEKFWVLG